MTIFQLARLTRTELIARYLAAHGPGTNRYAARDFAAMSRERLAAAIAASTGSAA
jgi:hypothetical protein